MGGDGDEAERDRDREQAHDDGEGGGHERPEGDDEHEQRERQRPLLTAFGVFGADGADVVIQGGESGDHHVEASGAGGPRQRVTDGGAQVRDEAGAQITCGLGRQGGDEKGGAPVLADEGRLPDGAEGDHLADVRALLGRRLQCVEDCSEPWIGPADRPVDDDRDVVGEWRRKRLLEELRGAAGFGALAAAAAQRERLLDVTRSRPEQQRKGRPRRDDPPAQADDGCRG